MNLLITITKIKPEIFSNFKPVLVTEDKSEIEFNKNFSIIGKIQYLIQRKINISLHLFCKVVMDYQRK